MRPGGQPWTGRVWVGTLIGLIGVGFVARPQGGISPDHVAGIVALQAGALSWTIGSLYVQSRPQKLPLFTASAVEMLAGAVMLGLESLAFREDLSRFSAASTTAWGAIAYLFVFGSLVGFTAFAYCLNELPASTVATYAYVNPVVAVALGALILHEPLSPSLLVGAALIVASVMMTTLRRQRPGPSSSARGSAD